MGSMSHEIRTPLNAINGFAELIAEGGLSKEESVEFAQIIRDNTQLFTALINDMLEVSQLDNTVAELPKMPVDICQLIRTEIERLPPKDGVEYRMDFAGPEIVVPLCRERPADPLGDRYGLRHRSCGCGTGFRAVLQGRSLCAGPRAGVEPLSADRPEVGRGDTPRHFLYAGRALCRDAAGLKDLKGPCLESNRPCRTT